MDNHFIPVSLTSILAMALSVPTQSMFLLLVGMGLGMYGLLTFPGL